MRACDQDLIRGGHYGQRSCEPHLQAEHMAASTNAATVKKALANSEPSTHGTKRTCRGLPADVRFRGRADVAQITARCPVLTRNGLQPGCRLALQRAPDWCPPIRYAADPARGNG